LKMIPPEVIADARKNADDPIKNKAVGLLFTILILCVWGLVLFAILSSLYKLIAHQN
jgi:hypothetical protein